MSLAQSSDYINIHRVPKQKPNTAYVSITKFSSCKNRTSRPNNKNQTGNMSSMCELNNSEDIYNLNDFTPQKDAKDIQNLSMKSRLLNRKSLDPHVISARKSIMYKHYLEEKERRSFFGFISKKFSDAFHHHFKNNQTGKIKTNHLKTKSEISTLINPLTNKSENPQSKLIKKCFRKMKSESWRFSQQSTEDVYTPSMLTENTVFISNEGTINPNKLSELVSYFGSRKDTEYYRKLKIDYNQSKLKHYIKDKPAYQQASQEYKSLYCVCKVCGLKLCRCSREEFLPFSSLIDQDKHNKSLSYENKQEKQTSSKQLYKFSTIRAMTAEPIHRKHAILIKKGKPIYKFSEIKGEIAHTNTPLKDFISPFTTSHNLPFHHSISAERPKTLIKFQNCSENTKTALNSSKRFKVLSKNKKKIIK